MIDADELGGASIFDDEAFEDTIAMTPEQIIAFIAASRWIVAKSMPEIPHEYTLKIETVDRMMFEAFVMHIRRCGYQKAFGNRVYTYLDVGDRCYWTMGAPVKRTTVINRAIKGSNA